MAKFEDLGISSEEMDRQLKPYADILATLSELRRAGLAGRGDLGVPATRTRSLSDLKRQTGRVSAYRLAGSDYVVA